MPLKCLQILWELGIVDSTYIITFVETTLANPLPGVFVYIYKYTNAHLYSTFIQIYI